MKLVACDKAKLEKHFFCEFVKGTSAKHPNTLRRLSFLAVPKLVLDKAKPRAFVILLEQCLCAGGAVTT